MRHDEQRLDSPPPDVVGAYRKVVRGRKSGVEVERMAQSSIEWTDAVWNPVTGCSKVSQGCKNCYAERMAQRFAGMNGYPADDPFRVTLHPDKLDLPLRWKKPRRIFVNSMSDLFHPDVPDRFIERVFGVMGEARQHTFQILTKRPARMLEWFQRPGPAWHLVPDVWPLPNVWLGASVENQRAADERIPLLLQTPAAVRFISAEPLLGPIDIPYLARCSGCGEWLSGLQIEHGNPQDGPCGPRHAQIDWIIAGGESGPGARPMHPDWARSLRDQCKAAGAPFLFKQHGEWRKATQADWDNPKTKVREYFGRHYVRVGKKAAGRLLDGVLWDQYPEVR